MVSREALVTWTMRVLAPLCVLLAVVGGFRHYSPVPFWDMWPGYVDFWVRLSEGEWGAWWAQHNEHRIVLARLLFWVDHAVFGGTIGFLFVVNYLLALAGFLIFRAMLLERAGPQGASRPVQVATLFVVICLSSWTQKENLAWGFQSQFFLAQSLPLLAFYLLHRASLPASSTQRRDFALACVSGVLSIGTMASGVIALPLMVLLAALLGLTRRHIAILGILAAACLLAYFWGYESPGHHGNLRDVLTQRPVRQLQYVLLYLGSPWYHLAGERSLALGQVMGLVLVLLSAWSARRTWRAPREHGLELVLLAFVLYVAGTAFGTGAGRLLFGLRSATADRYTTPALMAWMAVALLYLPALLRDLGAWRHRVVWPMLAVALLVSVHQFDAVRSQRALLFEREVAALAMELGVLDADQARHAIFSAEDGLRYASRAAALDVSVFGRPWLRDAREELGQPAGALPATRCEGGLRETELLPGAPGYRRVAGWIAAPPGAEPLHRLRIVAADGAIAGAALAGDASTEAMRARGGAAGARAFKGYVRTRATAEPVMLVSQDAGCVLRVSPPPLPPFDFVPIERALASVNVTGHSVLANSGWTGTDFQRSRSSGYLTLGSFVQGDQDTGEITLRLRRGDVLLYRTGPVVERQTYRIEGTPFSGHLTRAGLWAALVFDNPQLPDSFVLTLSDLGTGWGEWSAIGILDPATERPKQP